MSTNFLDSKPYLTANKLNKLLDYAVKEYVNNPPKNLKQKLVRYFHKFYKRFLILLIFKLKLIRPEMGRQTFWGEDIKMIGVRPYSLYNAGYIGNDDLFITKYIIDNLNKDDVFIDVGANIGFFTLLASCLVGGGGKIYAFEPIENTYNYLKKNTQEKGNVNIFQTAVHNRTGSYAIADFGIYNNFYNSLGSVKKLKSQLEDIGNNKNYRKYSVDTITLDEFCSKYDIKPNLIKLDTEDTEDLILSKSMKTIEKSKPDVIFEMFDLSVEEGRLDNIINIFSKINYRCYQFNPKGVTYLKSSKYYNKKYYNYLLIHKDNLLNRNFV